GLQDLAARDGLAIGYGILTVENEAQALARASAAERDKGGEAVRACLSLLHLKRRFDGEQNDNAERAAAPRSATAGQRVGS
ncbi:MAG: 6,7-dimethyl-8-ribityllumazine synthase, partial [Alphaproteobacteria bacterium]|nr:6,7-dimethyl-8-ribityllumazine synthase [Alphaproteobacteria bacterium]